MIRLFGQTDTVFSNNGDLVIQPMKCLVTKEDNGKFYADLETDLSYIDEITEGRILVIPTPQGDQAFRISNVKTTKFRIATRAMHVFYDSMNYLIQDSNVVNKSANDAMDHLNSATEPASPFTTISDLSGTGSFRCVRKSLFEAIKTVQARWGGHLVRDNWNIGLMAETGADNGVIIAYGKNIKDISVQYDWSKVVTKLMPVGYDGLRLPEVYLTSATQYSLPYTKAVSFNQNLDRDDYDSDQAFGAALIDDLRNQAQIYLDQNSIPRVNYTLSASIDRITDIGDTILVDDQRLGVRILTNVIAYEYDAILGEYTKIQFGNFRQTIDGFMNKVTSTAQTAANEAIAPARVQLEAELEEATAAIWNALGNSYVIYEGDRILVVDSLPKETATNVIMINAAGIGVSNTGINGSFNSVWLIDGTIDMQAANVINLTASMIRGGTLKLGALDNTSGILEIYDAQNTLIGVMDKDGLRMYGQDGSYVLMNADVGFAGFDRNDQELFWVSADEFHMRKSVVEEEITLCAKIRFIPITIYNGDTKVNDGVGIVPVI